jgi:polyhydroxybutyrate depolymerase
MKRAALLLSLFFASACLAAESTPPSGDLILTWQVDGVKREGMVHLPASCLSTPAPLVFVWHGHGGNMQNAVKSFGIHKLWPEAISVHLQGLNTPGRLTDPEGKKPGWQGRVGDMGDRDLKLFDAVLAQLRRDYRVDDRRIYSTGHSNGGGFTYLLWAQRGDTFAAMAPSSAASARKDMSFTPKPVMHIAGEKDPLVKFAWQQEAISSLKKINHCGEGKPWGDSKLCTEYVSSSGHPVITCIHPGGHEFLKEAPALMVKFFQLHTKPAP